MAFVLRRPFTLAAAARQMPNATQPITRVFPSCPQTRCLQLSSYTSRPSRATSSAIISSSRQALRNTRAPSSPRFFTNSSIPQPASGGTLSERLIYGAAIVGGAIVATNFIFNRETREDGGMPPFEREYLNDTFMHTGLGIGMIAVAASALHRSGWSYRLMTMNPWLVAGVGIAGSVGSMIATRSIDPDNYVPKYVCWSAFNVAQAAILSPLMFMQPALLARAGLYTAAMMGSLAFVGATAKQEKYLYIGGPLLAGCAIVAVSGFAPLVLPATAARTLMWTERIWLYGGLAVFGGFTLYDTQKVLHHARLARQGYMKRDTVNESISLELDFLNIFVRMVQILGMQGQRRR